ncbi:ADP-ribosyl cyclase/cyclic ADP-ribose hydrolase 1 isoform X2 [Scophthalmus maximus]|uniref:ADP-ribosyl cyclase/cyclic ADP-ribose hydrolase 1 isoform X2 n=1 Tax=Scophthalmus maximus TaxID=52904 RepID=UPI0015E0730F|nr:ADP-ribosyl cyclase/cyclic ADP-ribose hydrolase 1 isoform X2 [Scophthalmus maximus]
MHKHASLLRSNEAVQGLTIINSTFETFVMINLTMWLIMLLFCPSQLRAHLGTTPNIKHIVVGRCYNYISLVNPSSRYDCEEIWRLFEEAVVHQASCNVKVEDYHQMFIAMPHTWPCDRVGLDFSSEIRHRACSSFLIHTSLNGTFWTHIFTPAQFLFWSKTRALMHSYAATDRHIWTLEDTLVGFMFNDLIWCRHKERPGFDFSSCPEWSSCQNHPVYSLWRQASQTFAELACGNITVLLNGSIANAFDKKRESCSQGSVLDLIQILRSRGFSWTCTDNDQTLMILQCIQDPKESACQTCANSLSHRQCLTSN